MEFKKEANTESQINAIMKKCVSWRSDGTFAIEASTEVGASKTLIVCRPSLPHWVSYLMGHSVALSCQVKTRVCP